MTCVVRERDAIVFKEIERIACSRHVCCIGLGRTILVEWLESLEENNGVDDGCPYDG